MHGGPQEGCEIFCIFGRELEVGNLRVLEVAHSHEQSVFVADKTGCPLRRCRHGTTTLQVRDTVESRSALIVCRLFVSYGDRTTVRVLPRFTQGGAEIVRGIHLLEDQMMVGIPRSV